MFVKKIRRPFEYTLATVIAMNWFYWIFVIHTVKQQDISKERLFVNVEA